MSKEFIRIGGAREHNLQGVDVSFPLGCLVAMKTLAVQLPDDVYVRAEQRALAHRIGPTRLPFE